MPDLSSLHSIKTILKLKDGSETYLSASIDNAENIHEVLDDAREVMRGLLKEQGLISFDNPQKEGSL
jgi:hypothetical protein